MWQLFRVRAEDVGRKCLFIPCSVWESNIILIVIIAIIIAIILAIIIAMITAIVITAIIIAIMIIVIVIKKSIESAQACMRTPLAFLQNHRRQLNRGCKHIAELQRNRGREAIGTFSHCSKFLGEKKVCICSD